MLLDVVKKAVLRLFPELAAGLHLDRYARVVTVNDPPALSAAAEGFRPRYSVDLVILTPDYEVDPAYPVYSAVPLPVGYGAGDESGLYAFPEPGSLAVIGFAYGRPDRPIIRQLYPLGTALPQVGPRELVLQRGEEVSLRADEAGSWLRRARRKIAEKSLAREVEAFDYIVRAANEHKKISQHSVTEVQGISRIEAGLVDILAAMKADIGTLGELNLTAGGNSILSAAGKHNVTVGGLYSADLRGDAVAGVAGSAELTTGGDALLNVGGGLAQTIGADLETVVNGQSAETVTGEKSITGATVTISGATVSLAGAASTMAIGAKISMVSGSGSGGGGVNIMEELLDCLDNIIKAESELANGSGADGTGGGNPAPYITQARAYWSNLAGVIR